MAVVIPGIFGPNLALLGDYPWPAWRAASKFEPPDAPWEVENGPLCSSGLAQQNKYAPGQLPLPTWRRR